MESAIELPGISLGKRVMVVDDDLDFANSLGELIGSHSCEVEIVTTVQAAYQGLETFQPQVVMIDVRLGQVDGTSLLADFISHPVSPLCIMITGYASTESAIEALTTGAYDYLTKPVAPNVLFKTLDRCFERISLEAEREQALSALESRNHELEYTNNRLQRLVDSMAELASSTSESELCYRLLEKVAYSMGAEGGSMYLREGEQLLLLHSLDPGHAPSILPMPLNASSVLGRVMEQGEAVLVADAASSDGLMLSGWSGYRDESLLALPLVGQENNIIGVLSLHAKQKPPFTPQDCNIGKILLATSSETLRAVKALEDLQESDAMLRLIIDSSPDCVRVLDQDRNLVQMNPAGLAMVEVDSMDQVDECALETIDPEYRDAFERLTDSVYKGESGVLECGITGRRGTHRWIEVNAVPLRNRSQDIIGSLSVARDITQRREIEDELQESRSLLQLIIDTVPECVKVLDKDGNILQINKVGLDMCGADTFDQVDGANLYPLIKPEFREALQKVNEQAQEEGISGKLEYVLSGLKGKELWLETYAVPLRNANQEIIGVLDVARDITDDKRKMEQARQQELQLMQANKMTALGTLVAGVAHEINNPNQTIQINSGLLQQMWEDTQPILDAHVSAHGPIKLGGLQYEGLQGAHADLINDIHMGAEQIKTVVDRLRTFARPYDGIHDYIEGARIQLNDAVKSAIALLRYAIRKGTDSFNTSLEDNLPAIQGNRQQLQQIVINLILNALEALPDRTHGVRVDTRLNAEQSCVELRVRDEGNGINPDDLDQIMEPFFTTKRGQGGTGLGLAIIHSLLQDHGGTIHFESEPGKGTLVVVCLPVVKH